MNNAAILPDGSGVRLPLRTQVPEKKHAMRGGNPYPPEMRELVLATWQNGVRTPDRVGQIIQPVTDYELSQIVVVPTSDWDLNELGLGNRYDVYDGQQRLVTLNLLLAGLRDSRRDRQSECKGRLGREEGGGIGGHGTRNIQHVDAHES
jgi:hypothetical protein